MEFANGESFWLRSAYTTWYGFLIIVNENVYGKGVTDASAANIAHNVIPAFVIG